MRAPDLEHERAQDPVARVGGESEVRAGGDESVRVPLSAKTHWRAMTGNTRSREASGTAGGPRSLGQRPSDLAHTLT
jgi:hypothetical protein